MVDIIEEHNEIRDNKGIITIACPELAIYGSKNENTTILKFSRDRKLSRKNILDLSGLSMIQGPQKRHPAYLTFSRVCCNAEIAGSNGM